MRFLSPPSQLLSALLTHELLCMWSAGLLWEVLLLSEAAILRGHRGREIEARICIPKTASWGDGGRCCSGMEGSLEGEVPGRKTAAQ